MANLPAYSYADGPDSYGYLNRGGKDAHLADMPKMKTVTVTDRSSISSKGRVGTGSKGLTFGPIRPR